MKYKDSLKFKENIKSFSYTSKRKKRRKEAALDPGPGKTWYYTGKLLKHESRWITSSVIKEHLDKREAITFKRVLLTEKTDRKTWSKGIWGIISGATNLNSIFYGR